MHKLIALILVLMAACFARADITDQYLYWMIDQSATAEDERIEFFYAQLYAYNGTDLVALEITDGTTTSSYVLPSDLDETKDPPVGTYTEPTYSQLVGYLDDDYSSYSFYVELFDGSGTKLGWSEAVAYEELKSHIYSALNQTGAISYAFVPGVVPEPTSGLLVSLGLALLALRRRRPTSAA